MVAYIDDTALVSPRLLQQQGWGAWSDAFGLLPPPGEERGEGEVVEKVPRRLSTLGLRNRRPSNSPEPGGERRKSLTQQPSRRVIRHFKKKGRVAGGRRRVRSFRQSSSPRFRLLTPPPLRHRPAIRALSIPQSLDLAEDPVVCSPLPLPPQFRFPSHKPLHLSSYQQAPHLPPSPANKLLLSPLLPASCSSFPALPPSSNQQVCPPLGAVPSPELTRPPLPPESNPRPARRASLREALHVSALR